VRSHTPSLIQLYDSRRELSKIRDPRAAGCLLRASGDELFSLIAPPPTCYPTRSTMNNSLLTPHSLVRFPKNQFRRNEATDSGRTPPNHN
jgi:hypothetical protein